MNEPSSNESPSWKALTPRQRRVLGTLMEKAKTTPDTYPMTMLALLAAFSFGSSTVFSKKVVSNFHFVTSTFYRYGFTTLIMLFLMLIIGDFSYFAATTTVEWMYILLIGLTTGSGAIFLYYYGLRNVKAMMATISELLFPVSAVLFDYLINGSVLGPVQWLAAAVMVFSIIQLNRRPDKA